jgi:hypothetical protein
MNKRKLTNANKSKLIHAHDTPSCCFTMLILEKFLNCFCLGGTHGKACEENLSWEAKEYFS